MPSWSWTNRSWFCRPTAFRRHSTHIPTYHILNSSGLVQPYGRAIIWLSEVSRERRTRTFAFLMSVIYSHVQSPLCHLPFNIIKPIGSLPSAVGEVTESLQKIQVSSFSDALVWYALARFNTSACGASGGRTHNLLCAKQTFSPIGTIAPNILYLSIFYVYILTKNSKKFKFFISIPHGTRTHIIRIRNPRLFH